MLLQTSVFNGDENKDSELQVILLHSPVNAKYTSANSFASKALEEVLAILQPRVCIAWTTDLNQKLGLKVDREVPFKKEGDNRAKNFRIGTSPSLVVGVHHPS